MGNSRMKNKEKYETRYNWKENSILMSSLVLPSFCLTCPVSSKVDQLYHFMPWIYSWSHFSSWGRSGFVFFSGPCHRPSLWSCWLCCLSVPICHTHCSCKTYLPKPQLWLPDITIPVFKCSQGCHVEEREDWLFWTEIKVESKEGRVQLDINNYN